MLDAYSDWDYAWLIEPDVFINYAGISVLRDIDVLDYDLIATRVKERDNTWHWTPRLQEISDYTRIFGMLFPLVRLSRKLAEKCYTVRKDISAKNIADENLLIPNCESLVSTVAGNHGFTTLDLLSVNPTAFKNWDWKGNFRVEDAAVNPDPQFVHPIRENGDFENRIVPKITDALRSDGLLEELNKFPIAISTELIRLALQNTRVENFSFKH